MSNHYSCDFCGIKNVKLWRETYVSHIRPKCATCLGELAADVDADGKVFSKQLGCRTDQVGSWVPAVPMDKEDGYWGYSSVPDADVCWWKSLPSK